MRARGGASPLRRNGDLILVAAALVVAAAGLTMPGGSSLRLVAVAPMLLVVPGYVALQAATWPGAPHRRSRHLAASLGVSPAIVGLCALATALWPGGFRLAGIVGAVFAFCAAGVLLVVLRRRAHGRAELATAPAEDSADMTAA